MCDITAHIGAKRSNVSRHLGLMLKAGILACRKDGLRVMYSLRTPCILNFLGCVADVLREKIDDNNSMLDRL